DPRMPRSAAPPSPGGEGGAVSIAARLRRAAGFSFSSFRPIRFFVPALIIAFAITVVLAAVSLFVGVSDVSLASLLAGGAEGRALEVLLISRIPRTLALVLAGASMAIAGLVMQMVVRNRFVEPSTTGTTESAALGFLVVTLFAPGWPLMAKMGVSALF